MVLTFGRFLLLALLIGMIRGQGDHHDDLVLGQLWPAIQPLLASPPCRCGGRVCIDDLACLAGIVDQLRTGMAVRAGWPGRTTALMTPSARRSKRWYRPGASSSWPRRVKMRPGRAGRPRPGGSGVSRAPVEPV